MAMTPDKNADESTDSVAPLARYFLWTDSRKGVQRLIIGLVVLCVFLFAMEFVVHRHVKVPMEAIPGFYAIVGFVSFTVIVLGARLLRVFIRRDESYYAPHGVDAEEYPLQDTERLTYQEGGNDSLKTLRDQMLGREDAHGAPPPDSNTPGGSQS